MVSIVSTKDKLMNGHLEQRTYVPAEVVVFRKTKETFGGLSNMAPGFPVVVNNVRFWTCEALYQCCRFPDMPEVQKLIASEPSPMTAKMKSKKYRDRTRPDWENIRVRVMRWCLKVKLAQNRSTFGELLLSTGDKAIVEESAKDQFWGAKPDDAEVKVLTGANVLGRLLMELREQFRSSPSDYQLVPVPQIPNFLLFGRPVESINGRMIASNSPLGQSNRQDFEHLQRKATLSGSLDRTDWENFMHLLVATKVSPDKAVLNMELLLSPGTPDNRHMKTLAELAKKLGLQFKVL
jgi:ribA/ribD-fused uncharacterized protein